MHPRRYGVPILNLLLLTVRLQGRVGASWTPPKVTCHPRCAPSSSLLLRCSWSLDPQQFEAPEQRQRIQEALRLLAANTSALESHRQDVPLSFDFLRRTLARTAQDAAQRYEYGQYQKARFALQQLTAQCFACHSRFTHPQPFDLGKRFPTARRWHSSPCGTGYAWPWPPDNLRRPSRPRNAFRATTMSAAAIDLLGVFEDYLKIVLRVREDFARAIATCEQFLGRADVTPDLRERLLSWVEALKELQPQGSLGRRWGRARTLIEAGQRRNRFPADQLGLVHFVVASSLCIATSMPSCHHAGSLWKPTTSSASPNHLSRGPRGWQKPRSF